MHAAGDGWARERCVIEVDGEAVGLLLRGAGGFVFYAVKPEIAALEGRSFRGPRAVETAVRRLLDGRSDRAAGRPAAGPAPRRNGPPGAG